MGKKKHVCRWIIKQRAFQNNSGFTLVEALIALTVFIACTASFPLLYDAVYKMRELTKTEENVEWELFAIQLRNELHMADNWQISGGKLYFTNGEELISINQYQDKLRRQIEGKGHEVMLQNVKMAYFAFEGGKLYLHVLFQNGEQEGASFSPLSAAGF